MEETQLIAPPEIRQTFRVEVWSQHRESDTHHSAYLRTRLYFLEGALTDAEVLNLTTTLLADPITETFSITIIDTNNHTFEPLHEGGRVPASRHAVEVTLLPGVTDPAAENLLRAARKLSINSLQCAATGQRYLFPDSMTTAQLHNVATRTLFNPVIQRYTIDAPIAPPFVPVQQVQDLVESIPLRAADDARLMKISSERRLALNLAEMQAVRAFFQQEDREPTDAELEMLAQTWSEHCIHKTFSARIDYTGPAHGAPADSAPVPQTINSLLKTYIRAATEKVARPWLYSAFVDNAGIIAFDSEWDLAFKVETHNHPSALEPFGGANTGVGGVVRDILGVSARPIANTDVLCFGPPDLAADQLPAGVIPPQHIQDGVVAGVGDYGNKMGIPTVNGAILYHPGYTANPLVFCGCLGLLPHGSHPSRAQSGDLIVVIGGRTGRDGLRGATFSSMEMDTTTVEVSGSAVQIGHPVHEKQVQEVILSLRDKCLYHAITDCGAGGLSSAVGEMASDLGAVVQLEQVLLKYPGLRPWEIWLSEAQERMVIAVAPENWSQVEAICAGQDVEAACIGTFEATGRLLLFYGSRVAGNLPVSFLHHGLPQHHLKAEWKPPLFSPSPVPAPVPDLTDTLHNLLSHPNIRSKEPVIRRYDHEVQGGVAVRSLVGAAGHGPSDAAVLVPPGTTRNGEQKAVALSAGICPAYGEIDPYAMAWAAVDEALRNLTAVGADPDQVALLDNFCWGNPKLPDRLGALVRCAQGCYDAAVSYGAPYISGKDSLNNEYADADGHRHAIPGTLLISAVGIVPDVSHTVTMDLKQPGNRLYVVGETRDERGGSHYHQIRGIQGGTVPQPVLNAPQTLRALHQAITTGLVQSCHDGAEGGLAVTLAEMCLAGRVGAEIHADRIHESVEAALYSESLCRFIVEVRIQDMPRFEAILSGIPHQKIGTITDDGHLTVFDRSVTAIRAEVAVLEKSWRGEDSTDIAEPLPPQPCAQTRPPRVPAVQTTPPRVCILHANGTNRDHDAALACELAGAAPEIVHINQLLQGECSLLDYHMLVIPGGFSYGDDLGAGRLLALDLTESAGADIARFIREGRPVLGICNGFQTLVKAGLLPGVDWTPGNRRVVTLTQNRSERFECRWVYLQPNPSSPCLFTRGLDEPIYCPVAHGEGRVVASSAAVLEALWTDGLAALTYSTIDGSPAAYPDNPNGSNLGIAALCNPDGNVLGLMPHPENHIFPWQHPRWHRGERGLDGLRLFKNGVKYA